MMNILPEVYPELENRFREVPDSFFVKMICWLQRVFGPVVRFAWKAIKWVGLAIVYILAAIAYCVLYLLGLLISLFRK